MRQKKVIEILAENSGASKWEILKKAWYSVEIQENPKRVFESQAIQDFFKKDGSGMEALKKKHNDLLNSCELKKLAMPKKLSDDEINTFIEWNIPDTKVIRIIEDDYEKVALVRFPDGKLQKEALDMAYKILGVYKDPNATNPPPTAIESWEITLRISRAKQIFQLWTWND